MNVKLPRINRSIFLLIFLIGILACSKVSYAQQITVTGTVNTDDSNLGLPGVNVMLKGTSLGTVTDLNGVYKINIPEQRGILVFSMIGFQPVEEAIGNRSTINVTLKEDISSLDEVVVIGYGTESKKNLTSAIAQVKSEALNEVVSNTISGALKGKATGVRIYNTSGAPGAQSSITIRGGSSINKSNSPLILIDGMPGSLDNVAPQDVESIEILKDAASTAIYGARASNGIVLVTTKQGKANETRFTANLSYGYQQAGRKIDRLNSEQFLSVVRPALERSNYSSWLTLAHPAGTGNTDNSNFSTQYLNPGEAVPIGWKSMPDPLDSTKTLIFEDTNVEDNLFTGGNVLNAYLSASGGNDRIKYMTSLNYTSDDSFVPNSTWQNLTLRANTSVAISSKLNLNTNLGFTRSYSNAIHNQANLFSRSVHLAPTLRSVMPDGSTPGGRDARFNNPLHTLENTVYKTNSMQFTGRMGLEWDIIEGLVGKIDANYNPRVSHREYFERSNSYNSNRPAEYYGDFDQTSLYEATLNYNKQLNEDHKIGVLLGASSLSYHLYDYNAKSQGGSSDNIITLNASSEYLGNSSTRAREKLLSAFGRVSYNYKSKLLFSGTLRSDGSSKFSKSNQVGFFPGASIGYILSEEKFLNDLSWMSFLKVRGSYGLTGNNSVGRFDYQGVWSISGVYNGQAASTPSSIPNEGLSWEKSLQMDVGIEIGLLEDRVSVNMDYYDKKTKNLLFSKPLPNTSGFGSIETNIGEVKYYGFEIGVNALLVDKADFNLELGVNASHNMNKVLRLPENGFDKNRIGGIRFTDGTGVGGVAEGERMFGVIGYLPDFIIDNEEQAANAMYDFRAAGWDPATGKAIKGQKFPGDFEWVDLNGDGKITNNDTQILGHVVPTTTGGMHTKVTYKGFEFYILTDFALGHSIYDRQISLLNAYGESGYISPTTDVLDAWQAEGDAAKTDIPRFDVQDGSNTGQWNYYRTSTLNVYSGDYLAIREAKFSYSFNNKMLEKLNLSSMQVYASGLNLHYFTKYPGYITEYSGSNRNSGDKNYPNPRIISLGLNLGF